MDTVEVRKRILSVLNENSVDIHLFAGSKNSYERWLQGQLCLALLQEARGDDFVKCEFSAQGFGGKLIDLAYFSAERLTHALELKTAVVALGAPFTFDAQLKRLALDVEKLNGLYGPRDGVALWSVASVLVEDLNFMDDPDPGHVSEVRSMILSVPSLRGMPLEVEHIDGSLFVAIVQQVPDR